MKNPKSRRFILTILAKLAGGYLIAEGHAEAGATDWNLLFQGVLISASVRPGLRGCKELKRSQVLRETDAKIANQERETDARIERSRKEAVAKGEIMALKEMEVVEG